MPELRLALIAIGVLLVVAVYLFSRFQGNDRDTGMRPGRHRPRVDQDDLPSISVGRPASRSASRPEPPPDTQSEFRRESPTEARLASLRRRISAGFASLTASSDTAADDDKANTTAYADDELPRVDTRPDMSEEVDPAAEALKGFDPDSQKIISLHVLAVGEVGMDGGRLRGMLEDNGCLHGHYGIFHRSERDDSGRPSLLFSVANIVEPGRFDLDSMDQQHYRGVTLFAVLPGPWSGLDAFHEMLSLARRLADELGGDVRDEARNAFSRQRATHIEEQITEFERMQRQRRDRRGS